MFSLKNLLLLCLLNLFIANLMVGQYIDKAQEFGAEHQYFASIEEAKK